MMDVRGERNELIARISRVLLHEERTGFLDRAVFGGLEKFVTSWSREAEEPLRLTTVSSLPQEAAEAFQAYGSKDTAEREKVVRLFIRRLAEAGRGPVAGALPTPAGEVGKNNVRRRERGAPVAGASARRQGEAPSPQLSLSGRGSSAVGAPRGAGSTGATSPRKAGSMGAGSSGATSGKAKARSSTSARSSSPARLGAAGSPLPRAQGLDSSVRNLPGVGSSYAAKLEKLGCSTIRDLLYLIPRRHIDYSVMKRVKDLRVGEVESCLGTIWDIETSPSRSGIKLTTATVADETGTINVIWFNQPHLTKTLTRGRQVVLSGRVEQNLGRPFFKAPDWELAETSDLVHTGRMVPVYPLTEGLPGRWMRALLKRVVDRWVAEVQDHLPERIRKKWGLVDLATAIYQIHFPDDASSLRRAQWRLAFDELFIIQLGMLLRKREWQESQPGNSLAVNSAVLDGYLSSLPFDLTAAQKRVTNEIIEDLKSGRPMVRLLQGDVGSGKTVVATLAMVLAWDNGFQSALMAPTEILAEQHYQTISKLTSSIRAGTTPFKAGKRAEATDLATMFLNDRNRQHDGGDVQATGNRTFLPLPESTARTHQGSHANSAAPVGSIKVGLLTGSISKAEKDAMREAVARGEIDIVVGTHAVIQEGVTFRHLGLVVIDEQHRFGVEQRSALRQKGYNPHLLVMTATPIPRTLALALYGDLDISTIDELPPGRQEVKTYLIGPEHRQRAYEFVRREVKAGRQAFVICPLVEESERIEAKAATAEYERLSRHVFPDLKLGLLHGKMRPKDKESVMADFRDGRLDILVSTSVVEVGIDIPNATVMLVEGADRFGLSQIHQFRGRVGRGTEKSYCLLVAESPSGEAEERLQVATRVHNGLLLAEEDLRLRGPGEFFGTKQSGVLDLKVARMTDVAVLQEARSAAEELLLADKHLQLPENRMLAQKVKAFWRAEGYLS